LKERKKERREGRQGRRSKQLRDEFKEKSGYWKHWMSFLGDLAL
jgi:hypothetical protein